eukprot:326372-Rhodomonas_salina.3
MAKNICLCNCYAVSGTEIMHFLYNCCAMPGTEIQYTAVQLGSQRTPRESHVTPRESHVTPRGSRVSRRRSSPRRKGGVLATPISSYLCATPSPVLT